MTLKEYLISNKLTHASFAEQIGCTRQYITAICSGKRAPGMQMVNQIIAETNGLVGYKVLRPDIYNMIMGGGDK